MRDISITAGLLIRWQVRNELERSIFDGDIEGYKELKGVLDSEFLIRGANDFMIRKIKYWEQSIET